MMTQNNNNSDGNSNSNKNSSNNDLNQMLLLKPCRNRWKKQNRHQKKQQQTSIINLIMIIVIIMISSSSSSSTLYVDGAASPATTAAVPLQRQQQQGGRGAGRGGHPTLLSSSPPSFLLKINGATSTMELLKISSSSLLPPLSIPRGGGDDGSTGSAMFDQIFSPSVALKATSIGLFWFAIQILFQPKLTPLYINGGDEFSNASNKFILFMWGVRELILSILSWKISSTPNDYLCRYYITLFFFCINIPQVYYLITNPYGQVLTDQAKHFILTVQIGFLIYLGITALKSWFIDKQEVKKG